MSTRDEFEAWIADTTSSDLHRGIMLDRHENGRYRHLATENKWEAWQAATNAMEAKCAAMAAEKEKFAVECAATKIAIAYLKSGRHDFTLNTPATDAFLAEVRAQGVEMLASLAGNECQRYKSINDRSGARKWKSIVILCTDFAAQIRKGVQS
ncbi:TPA: hypothetical protein I4G93_20705 [Enterobacter hormaechei subsp. xiangfangensis]|nr:hypothetical protein [Enterobacter hormaechei subsp. xiangfangensis]HAS1822501.1 hypothetical protein [Enterobacter hormaechei subsp. xiangfangensis]HAS1827975.1 hypothetical protein [Enterobacter hormaechei subsp. xiangfangensis]HAS1867758.1 hypothetical protein [Enterobacter hormaechei subsp. xiangfangensis]HAS1872925.1 hypothetical protein [Enterobacter hormaechei subsp. xiangfangensis]